MRGLRGRDREREKEEREKKKEREERTRLGKNEETKHALVQVGSCPTALLCSALLCSINKVPLIQSRLKYNNMLLNGLPLLQLRLQSSQA
jgi:hypothetical protein